MTSGLLQHAAMLSGVTTLAASFVALCRVPLRAAMGARAAYWLWLSVPVSAAALALPHLAAPSGSALTGAPDVFEWLSARMQAPIAALHPGGASATAVGALWVAGAGAALALMVIRQRSFARSLGTLAALPDGTWRSRHIVEPMLIGAWRPKMLVPSDFERRYGAEERMLILAHERAHVRRGDLWVNALAALWLCLFWFNPVMFWAVRLLRFDQDLACDAAVLAAAGNGCRARYAEALLKTQLAGEGARLTPLLCHWRSVHPLRRRVAALRRPVAGRTRHALGVICAAVLAGSVSLAAQSLQSASALPAAAGGARRAAPGAAAQALVTACPLSLRHAGARRPGRAGA